MLYHFCEGAAIATLRVRLPRAEPKLVSISGLIPAAAFFERELSEMFGISIPDASYPEHLFLPEDWPSGVFPLRKDFQMATSQAATKTEEPSKD